MAPLLNLYLPDVYLAIINYGKRKLVYGKLVWEAVSGLVHGVSSNKAVDYERTTGLKPSSQVAPEPMLGPQLRYALQQS